MQYIYLNHRLLPQQEAFIPVTDRGFRFGDGVFETIRVHNGVPYRFEWHMQRLAAGLKATHIAFDTINLQAECADLLKRNACREGLLRIQITRGSSGSGYLPAEATPTCLIETLPLAPPPAEPISLHLSSYRRVPAACLPISSKLAQGMNSTLARMEAHDNGCFEALQLTTSGIIAEGSSSNIFWRRHNIFYTPALDAGVLDGGIRAAILTFSGFQIREVHADMSTLAEAEAVVMVNSAWLALPVASLKPAGITWDSAAAASQLNMALHKDIKAYTEAARTAWYNS